MQVPVTIECARVDTVVLACLVKYLKQDICMGD